MRTGGTITTENYADGMVALPYDRSNYVFESTSLERHIEAFGFF